MDSKQLASLCREFAENKKAENIVVLDVRNVSTITDYFVIASGTSEPHLRSITGEITDRLRTEYHLRPASTDGDLRTAWQVVDYFDVIVHVMRADVRAKYDLETLWGDAPRMGTKKKRAAARTEAATMPKRTRKATPVSPNVRKGKTVRKTKAAPKATPEA